MSSQLAKVTLFASFWTSPQLCGVDWKVASKQIPAIFGRPKSTLFREMQVRPGEYSDGSPKSVSKNWSAPWSSDLELAGQERTLLRAGHQINPRGRVHG